MCSVDAKPLLHSWFSFTIELVHEQITLTGALILQPGYLPKTEYNLFNFPKDISPSEGLSVYEDFGSSSAVY